MSPHLFDARAGSGPSGQGVSGRLLSLNVGVVGTIESGGRVIVSGFHKTPVETSLRLGTLGFPGDEHVYEGHGGPEKAVCVYPYEHYAYWEDRLSLELPASAAFGENFTMSGLTERQVCLGDVFAIGEAVVQVTQPRAPCFKIAARYGVPKMAVLVQQESFTGYLLRVLEEGEVRAGQAMRLVERSPAGITVAEANQILNVNKKDLDGAERLLALPRLPEPLREDLERRVRRFGSPEDTERLFGHAD